MFGEELRKANETILNLTYHACVTDIDRACITYSLHRNVAETIAKMSTETLLKLSKSVQVLIHPSLIPHETWLNLDSLNDDALSALTIIPNINGNR